MSPSSRCAAAVSVFSLVLAVELGGAQNLTNTAGNEDWGNRNHATSRGRVLWYDENDTVWMFNGAAASPVQPKGDLDGVEDNVFALGSGSGASDVIGAWRRGTDFAWVSINGGTPVLVTATNPIDANEPTNPEAVAIADGCVFMALQAFAGGEAVQHIFSVNPVTGSGVNLTGTDPVPGRGSLISTSGCEAVWMFDDGTNVPGTGGDTGFPREPIYKLHYYDGATVATIDEDATLGQPKIFEGLIVYTKEVGGIRQVFVYDTNAPAPESAQLSHARPGKGAFGVAIDASRIAWISDRDVMLDGDVPLTNAATRLPAGFLTGNRVHHPVQLDHGQLLWTDLDGALRLAHDGSVSVIGIAPATTHADSWLADSFVAWLGSTGTNIDVFRHTAPAAVSPGAPLAIVATPGLGRVDVTWERIRGADSYNVYMAEETGVTKSNYDTLDGGRKLANVTSPLGVTGLVAGQTYYFKVTVVEGGLESGESPQAQATVPGGAAWVRAFPTEGLTFHDVKSDRLNAMTLYAASNGSNPVWKSIDGGTTWSPLPGAVNGRDVRAVAANGMTVLAVTKDGDILRSVDGGSVWSVVADGDDIGEQQKTVMFSPHNGSVAYASDIDLTASPANYVVKSIDGGATWSQLPDDPSFEIRAYAMAEDPGTAGTLYAGGTGVPVGKSVDGGTNWDDVQPAAGFFYALAAAPSQTVYAAGVDFSATSIGVFKSVNGGTDWDPANTGLPGELPHFTCLLVDPLDADDIYAGSWEGFYSSTNGAGSWSTGPGSFQINALALTSTRRLVAAANDGLYILPLTSAPAATSVAPSAGVEAGGTSVVVSGTGFVPSAGLAVHFGGVAGTVNLGASSTTAVTVTSPPHAPGVVDVVVTNPDGQTSLLADAFTYTACSSTISPGSRNHSASSGSGSVAVTAAAGCPWLASAPGGSFATVTSGASGSGNGTVNYSVSANGSGAARTVTLTVAGEPFVVTQNASGATAPLLSAAGENGSVEAVWTSTGATSYQLFRSSNGGPFALVHTTGGTSFTDATVANGTGYLYRVSSFNGATQVAYSNVDLAVPFAWTDPIITAQSTEIRAAHFTQLRTAVNAARAALGWPAQSFTDVINTAMEVRRIHLVELRSAAAAVRSGAGLPAASFTDPAITIGVTLVKKVHIDDLRAAMQ